MTDLHANGDGILAWHWVADTRLLRDGQPLVVGKTYHFDGEPVMCQCGLHASKRILDALKYALGAIVCRVRLGGNVLHDTDKMVGTQRKVLWAADATRVLHLFACDEAERALKRAKVADPRSWNAIMVKRKWLAGKASNRELDAAGAAAWEAAMATAWTAWDAANQRLTDAIVTAARAKGIDA